MDKADSFVSFLARCEHEYEDPKSGLLISYWKFTPPFLGSTNQIRLSAEFGRRHVARLRPCLDTLLIFYLSSTYFALLV
jgi:hypothetical protein